MLTFDPVTLIAPRVVDSGALTVVDPVAAKFTSPAVASAEEKFSFPPAVKFIGKLDAATASIPMSGSSAVAVAVSPTSVIEIAYGKGSRRGSSLRLAARTRSELMAVRKSTVLNATALSSVGVGRSPANRI
jgi:hypothetical protein